MQQRFHYNPPIALNGAAYVSLMQQTQQTLPDNWPVVLSSATEMSSMQQTLHYNGPATRCADFIRLNRRQLTYAACLRWPVP